MTSPTISMSLSEYQDNSCRFNNTSVSLTKKEKEVLRILLHRRGEAVPIKDIEDQLWYGAKIPPKNKNNCLRQFFWSLARKLPGVIQIPHHGYKTIAI